VSVVANVAINVDSRNAVTKLREVQSQATATERAFGGVTAAVGKLVAAFAAVQAVKFVFVQAAELQSQARSLEVLTGSAQKAGQIIKELQQLGAVTPFTSTELIDSAKRLQAFGVETDKVVETTRRLADASGATGAELSGLVTAFGQVQAKGRLQGEELLQFQERGIALQQELRAMYGMTGDEFQKALSKGQISAQAVEVALQRLTDAGGKYANGAIAQSDTLNGKLSTLQDSFQRLAQNIGTFFEPVFKFLLDGINAFLDRVNNGLRVSAQLQANEQAAIRTRNKFGAFRAANPFDQEAQQYEERLRKSLFQSGLSANRGVAPRAPSAAPSAPALLSATSGGAGRSGGARSSVNQAARDAERLAEELKRSIERGDQLFRQFSRTAALTGDITETERKRLQIQYDYQDRAREIAELKNAEQQASLVDLNNEIRKLEILQLQKDELKEQLKLFYERAEIPMGDMLPGGAGAFRADINLDPNDRAQQKIDEFKAQLDALQDPINMAQRGAQGIGDAFATSFQGVITGAMTAQEALASFFQNVAKTFIDMATEIIAQMVVMYAFKTLLGLFGGAAGGGGGFSGAFGAGGPTFSPGAFSGPSFMAEGGFVTGPTSAIIGEGGESEYVIPASKMQSAMARYSRGARGEAVIPATGGSEGGDTPAAGGPMAIDVRYTVERINSVDYVTADQFQQGMRQAAQQGATQGEQRTLRRLQQSSSTRRRIGV
jgi:tape measure domain-containing protein